MNNPVAFSINDILDYIQPIHLEVFVTFVFLFALVFSIIILFHLNKYKDYSPITILIKIAYLLGIIILFLLAFTCVNIYSLLKI